VPVILEQANPDSKNAVALVCGPPIMNKVHPAVLDKLGFKPENIYTTLENRMKCGLGKCGVQCGLGLCLPRKARSSSAAQMKELPLSTKERRN